MRVSVDDVRKPLLHAQWKLYVISFPSCVDPNHTWPSDRGVSVYCAIKIRATKDAEGEISVTFLDDPSGEMKQFLHDWQEGVWETNTGKQRATKELIAEVTFREEHSTEPDLNVFLKFPIDCVIDSETPGFRAVYYNKQ